MQKKEQPTDSKEQNKKSTPEGRGSEDATLVQCVTGKWARSLIAALILLLLLLAAAFYMPSSADTVSTHAVISHEPGPGLRKKSTYCSAPKDCEIVCTDINSADLHPGHVAADFIESNDSRCENRIEVPSLQFVQCTFPEFKLRKGWLPMTKTIKDLKLDHCNFHSIEDGAFSNLQFTSDSTLTMDTFMVSVLRKNTLSGVMGLKGLQIRSSDFLNSVEEDFLAPVAYSLERLQVEEMSALGGDAIRNMTGANAYLNRVVEIVINYNHIEYIGPQTFFQVPSLKKLVLIRNGITEIHPKAFYPISNSIELMILTENALTTMDEETLQYLPLLVLMKKVWFQIYLEGNPWNCDCSLVWLQEMMNTFQNTFLDIPVCNSPQNLYKQPIKNAAMCGETTTLLSTTTTTTLPSTTITTTKTPTPTTTTPTTTEEEASTPEETTTLPPPTDSTEEPDLGGSVTVECSNYQENTALREASTSLALPMRDLQRKAAPPTYAKRHLLMSLTFDRVDFNVKEVDDGGTARADLGNVVGTVIQMSAFPDDNLPLSNYSCYTNATGAVYFRDLRPDSSYTFCLLTDVEHVSPFNCKALRTMPSPGKRTWVAREDRFAVAGGILAGLIMCGVLFAAVAFFIVWRYPSILKNNKRVVPVKSRLFDVMVLPRNEKDDVDQVRVLPRNEKDDVDQVREHQQQVNTTDSGQRPSLTHSISQISTARSSSTSYISAVEPTPSQLMQWRLDNMRARLREFMVENVSSYSDNPPPLPPRPITRESSSCSLNYDSHKTSCTTVSEA